MTSFRCSEALAVALAMDCFSFNIEHLEGYSLSPLGALAFVDIDRQSIVSGYVCCMLEYLGSVYIAIMEGQCVISVGYKS